MTIHLTAEQSIAYLDGSWAAWRIEEEILEDLPGATFVRPRRFSSVMRVPWPFMSRRPACLFTHPGALQTSPQEGDALWLCNAISCFPVPRVDRSVAICWNPPNRPRRLRCSGARTRRTGEGCPLPWRCGCGSRSRSARVASCCRLPRVRIAYRHST